MNNIDKNDVDISKLFSWGRKITIKDEEGEEYDFYMRLIGDADLNRARTIALRHSNQLRQELNTPNSEKRLEFIPDVSEISREELANLVVISQIPKLTRKAMTDVNIPYPKEPDSDADLEKLEAYQKEIDEYPTKRTEKIKEIITKESEILEKETKKKSFEELTKEYEKAIIKDTCEMEMVRKFQNAQVFFASFLDSEYKTPVFKTLEEFENLRSFVKEQFLNAYTELELSMDELKK